MIFESARWIYSNFITSATSEIGIMQAYGYKIFQQRKTTALQILVYDKTIEESNY